MVVDRGPVVAVDRGPVEVQEELVEMEQEEEEQLELAETVEKVWCLVAIRLVEEDWLAVGSAERGLVDRE